MKIAEVYKSIQGEGELTGAESVFVRASGCNLRCWFCDTPYASWQPEGVDLSLADIRALVDEWDCRHVVLTGGEPMLFAELVPLTEELRGAGRHITIETAGTLYLPVACDLMSISPKFASSAPRREEHPRWHARHEATRHRSEVITRLVGEFPYQVKFVIDTREDFAEAERYLAAMSVLDRRRVWMMPQGRTAEELAVVEEWLKPRCAAAGVRYCPRKQVEWFGAVRGT